MVGGAVVRLVPDDSAGNDTSTNTSTIDQERVMVAASVTFLSGVFQVGKLQGVCPHVHISTYRSKWMVDWPSLLFSAGVVTKEILFPFPRN